jgi:hypothetical protein
MGKGKVTGKSAAAAASKVLLDGRTGKASKAAAGSALSPRLRSSRRPAPLLAVPRVCRSLIVREPASRRAGGRADDGRRSDVMAPERAGVGNETKEQLMSAEKTVTVIVNARAKEITAKLLTFGEVVALAFDAPPTGDNVMFTVTYRRGHGSKPEGSLVAGEAVIVKEGMVFNVTATDKS